jgi:hypothetical protein
VAAPAFDPNLSRILDGVDWLLSNRLSQAYGRHTDGAVIIRDMDPRYYQANYAKEYAVKNRCISIKSGDAALVPPKSLGGTKRFDNVLQLWCLLSLTDAEQRSTERGLLGKAEAKLRKDLVWLLDSDSNLQIAGAALEAETPGVGYDEISCINLRVTDFGAGDIVNWPNAHFIALVSFEYDEFRHNV